jgi:hypothetical protein
MTEGHILQRRQITLDVLDHCCNPAISRSKLKPSRWGVYIRRTPRGPLASVQSPRLGWLLQIIRARSHVDFIVVIEQMARVCALTSANVARRKLNLVHIW